MSNSQQASASGTGSTSVGSTIGGKKVYTNDDILCIKPTNRKAEIFTKFDLCHMKDGAEKARCKRCLLFFWSSGNTTLRNHWEKCSVKTPTNDVSQGPDEFATFDILAWWKEREVQFPILAAMARDLLAVQASTVASESAFSTSGRIISERRSRLTPESVEVCVCLKDYLDGVDRIQHATTLEGPILEDVEDNIAREENEAGISPPNTELDEGEYEDIDQEQEDEDVDVDDF